MANSGSFITHLPEWVEAFCWDGSLVVTQNGNASGKVSVTAWRDGVVKWSTPEGYFVSRVEAQPDGSGLAIWVSVKAKPQGSGSAPSDLYVVGSEGQVLALIRNTN